MRILLVDDNIVNRASAQEILGGKHKLTIVESYEAAEKELTSGEKFEVVLVDLMLPSPGTALGQEAEAKYLGQEMPLGFPLMLLALKSGCKKVGIVTNTNHHDHPMSAVIDIFNDGPMIKPFIVGDACVVCCNRPVMENFKIKCKAWLPVLKALQTDKPVQI